MGWLQAEYIWIWQWVPCRREHPGEKVVTGKSFIGESEGKDDLLKLSGVFWFPRKLAIQIVVYTSFEVPGKRV